MIILELFLSFLQIGLFSVGGGYAAIPLIREQALEKHGWMTAAEFSDLITVSEMTPGPVGINSASFIGARLAGVWGAVAASLGFIVPSLIFVTALYFVYKKYSSLKTVNSVLRGIRPAVTGLIASSAVSMVTTAVLRSTRFTSHGVDIAAVIIFLAAFFVLRKFKASPIAVLLFCGAAGFVIYYITGGI